MRNITSYKTILYPLKYIIYTFVIFFTFITISVFGCLFYLSSHEIYVSSPKTINVLKKIINIKNRDIELSFSSLYFKQSSLKDMRFDVIIYNLNVIQKKTKLLIVDVGDVEIFISSHEAISGQFVPKINEISNKTIHIPVNIVNSVKGQSNMQQTNVVSTTTNINATIKGMSLIVQRLLTNTKLMLTNGISITNTNINLLNTTAGKQINSFKIKDFYLKTTTFVQLTEKQKQDFIKLVGNGVGTSSSSRLTLSKKLYQKISIFNKKYTGDITIYRFNMDYHGKQVQLSGICDYNKFGMTSSCLIDVENLPLALLVGEGVVKQTQINVAIQQTNVNGSLHVFFDEKGIKQAILNGELKQLQSKKIQIKSRQITKISLTANVLNNFTHINSAMIGLYDDKNNIISNIKTDNATFSDGLLKNSNVYFTINNIKLSDFYSFINKTLLPSYNNIYNIDGIINGTLCFSFNSEGKLVKKSEDLNHSNSIQLKHLLINSKLFDFDLSKFIFSLEMMHGNVVLRTQNINKNKSGDIILRYDYVHNGLSVKFDKTMLTKQDFNQFKKLFLDTTQFNIMKNIELSLLIDGQVFVPFDKTLFAEKSIFDLTMQVLSTDDDLDDEILFKIIKHNNTKKGDIEINFGKSIMYSQMFAFVKQENDLSIIRGTFEFIDGKSNGLKINTSWKLNDVEKSTFKFSFVDGIVYALLKSKISQLEVIQKGREYKVGLSGSSVYVDYEFWHIILLLISFLKDYDLMQVYLDVDDGAIQDVKLDDVRFLINIKPPFFYGHFDFNMHYEGRDYNGMHFVSDKGGKYDIDVPNIVPLLTLYDVDITKLPFYKLSLSGKGKSDIDNKILDGDLNIKFDSEDTGLFGFAQLYSLNVPNLRYDNTGLMCKQGEFKARWFDVKDIDIGLQLDQQKSHITANLKASVPLISTKYVPVKMAGNTFQELFSKVNINNTSFTLDKNFQVNELVKVII